MTPNNYFAKVYQSNEIIEQATIYINKKTVQFGQEVYQFNHVIGFGVAPIKNPIPDLWIILYFVFGMALLFVYKNIFWGTVLLLNAVLPWDNNYAQSSQYGLGLYLASGEKKIFVTSDKNSLTKIIQDLHNYMNNDEDKRTYVIDIVRGNIAGNYTAGTASSNNINFR